MRASAEELVQRFYADVWNRADEAEARRILHREVRFRGSLGVDRQGPDGFIAYMRSVHTALADYTCTIEELVAEEHRAAARMRFEGVHQGPFFGVEATDRRVSWAGAAFFRTDGERIIALWVLGDVEALRRQLGAPGAEAFDGSAQEG